MPRRVLIQRELDVFDLVETPAPNEHHLQEIMKNNPQLIPSDDLGLDGELLVVGRETGLASGYIDLLCLARSGDLVLIEFKTGPQNPDFRHALAQLIDYGSDLWRMSVDDFDRGVVQRFLSGSHSSRANHSASNLTQAIEGWDLTDDEQASLVARLADVLATGDFHYVVAAQRFTPVMQTSLEYMNATMRFGRFFLVEIVQLEGAELVAHAAQVVAAPSKSSSSTSSRVRAQAEESTLLASLGNESEREAVSKLLAAATALGLEVKWRSRGVVLRVETVDRSQPLAVAWIFPPGAQWHGARHMSFGVDQDSLAKTPSIAGAIATYIDRIGQIPGGTKLPTLRAYQFEPAAFPGALTALTSALEQLVEELGGED